MRSQTIINLTFHGIGDAPESIGIDEHDVWLSTDRFIEVLDVIKPVTWVRATFDDGNKSDIETALPALISRGMRASFFVCAGRIGRSGYLDAADLRTLVKHGMRVGLHGMDHVSWRSLDKSRLDREIHDARRMIASACGAPVREAACPFGAYDRRVLAFLRVGGMERVFTSDRGPARQGAWLQARNTIRRSDDTDAITLTARDRGFSIVRTARRLAKRWR